MKLKTMAMLAAGGLMAASLAFVTPALAEDGFEDGMAPQQLAMNDSGDSMQGDLGPNANETQAAPFDTAANNQDNSPASKQQDINAQQPQQAQQAQQAQQPQAVNQSSQANAATEQPTADVASGDEDF